ncbi:unnamed protein product [Caenorhabditis brenneri]
MAPRSSTVFLSKENSKKFSGIPKVAEARAFKTFANDNREVRVNLYNLSPSIHSCDLRDYFTEFKIKNFAIDFNQLGQPTGTGFVVLPKWDAHRMILKYSGVSINGQVVKLVMVEEKKVPAGATKKREATIEDIENDMDTLDLCK